MPGYQLLSNDSYHDFWNETQAQVISVPSRAGLSNPYRYEKKGNVVTILTPINTHMLAEVLKDIKGRMHPNDHLLLGVVGQGLTERHIVTMHLPPLTQSAIVYDSKKSDPELLFSLMPPSGRYVTALKSGLQALNPGQITPVTIDGSCLDSPLITSIDYHVLGTQSIFDGVSCGYHTLSTLRIVSRLIEQGKTPTTDLILEATNNPVKEAALLLDKTSSRKEVDASFISFLKQAWHNTLMPQNTEDEREKRHFGHYFMGWPEQNKGNKWVYFLTLGFLTNPLIKTAKLVTEFPLNALSESAAFLKNQLIAWAPGNGLTQGLRSMLILTTLGTEKLFKAAHLLIRTITSPIISYQEAKKVHPLLGVASAIASILLLGGGLAALAVFATPLLGALAPGMGPGFAAVLNALATPASYLFSLMGVSLSTGTAAAITAIGAGMAVNVLQATGELDMQSPVQQQEPLMQHTPEPGQFDDFDMGHGSNVSQLLSAAEQATPGNMNESNKSNSLDTEHHQDTTRVGDLIDSDSQRLDHKTEEEWEITPSNQPDFM